MHLTKVLLDHQFWPTAVLLGLDGCFFGLTNPTKVAAPSLIVGFILLTLTSYVTLQAVCRVAQWYGIRFGRHRRQVVGLLTTVIGALVGLQSMGELTSRDICVIVPLASILYFYMIVAPRRMASAKA